MWRGETEDGTGWGGIVAIKKELREEARQAAIERDAARYRWLRDCGSSTWVAFRHQWKMSASECDAAVDVEMRR